MTILVTGARGNIGSRLVAALTCGGHAVRATTRDPSATAGLPADVETVELDVTDPHHAAAALRGVEAVFLYAVRGEITGFLDAARDAGVEYVVLLSSPASFEAHEHDRHIGRVHRAVERSLEDSGLPHTLLYPSWLATNAARDWAGQIRATGSVALPFPDAQFNPIHPGDVAEIAARLLTDAGCRARLQILTGPESLRLREIVAVLGDVLGSPIRIDEVTRQQALENRPGWMPEAVLDSLLDAERAAVDVMAPVNNAVERLTGRLARPFRAWAEDHKEALADVLSS
jgi:uncharacterized protein YbjT (DUF2867 family)